MGTQSATQESTWVSTEIDYSSFSQSVHVRALKVPKEMCNEVSNLLKGYLFERPRLRHVLIDPEDNSLRLVLLHPDIKDRELIGLPEEKKEQLVERGILENIEHAIELDYKYLSADDILEKMLPAGLEIPSSFETIGHIAHMNLRDELLPFKSIIGQVLLDKNKPRIRTIVNKVGTIESEYRVPNLEVIAGEMCLETNVKQYGANFTLNYGTVYWNSRLENEHKRLVKKYFKKGDVICDMFAGIGPFAIPAAMAGCFILANDLNPDSVKYLTMNSKKNKVDKKILCFNEDARDFMRRVCKKDTFKGTDNFQPWRHFDHAVMNLPASALEFLDVFNGLLGDSFEGEMPFIHCYCFMRGSETKEDVLKRASEYLGGKIEDASVWNVRDVAPNKIMLCISFKLPKSVAFSITSKKIDVESAGNCVEPNTVENELFSKRQKLESQAED